MKKKPRTQAAKSSKKTIKNLAPASAEQVKAGRRMEAQLKSRSVNPIVISRDRALGNG
jgi:hypothetical protein